METPNILKGALYPSSRRSVCPRFHACIVSKKCQNFDQHMLECIICESRVDGAPMIGGYIPEGEYYPDLQDAIHTIEDRLHRPLADPNDDGQKMDQFDVSQKYQKERKAADMMHAFLNGPGSMEEKIVNAMVDPKLARLLGRME